jgi:cysteinyl-tRNA synthetase
MTMRLYNTLTRTKELLNPHEPGKVGIYLCGPTVYKPSHIGHAVGPVIFDVLARYLKYKGYDVTFVINVTDVDDKLITEAAARDIGVAELASHVESLYVEAIRRLGVRTVDHMPRVSEHMTEIVDAIARLVDRGHAYAADGSVYFDVSRDEAYGKLSNRKVEELRAATRDNLVEAGKRNPGDFALWKAAKPGEPDEVRFDSPWGPGRPGWHIECSAMSMKYLGETFDIHGGGMDLIFPHHENEIAQSECMTGKAFARVWMHHGLTRFNTKKISKSDPEFQAQMDRLLLTHLLQSVGPELLRYVIISSHYRSAIDFSDETVEAARKGLKSLHRLFSRIERLAVNLDGHKGGMDQFKVDGAPEHVHAFREQVLGLQLRFLEAMDDDLNTAVAVSVLHELTTAINRYIESSGVESKADDMSLRAVGAASSALRLLGGVMGLFEAPATPAAAADDGMLDCVMRVLIETRQRARKSKQFELADFIRDALDEVGVQLEDRADGTGWSRQ